MFQCVTTVLTVLNLDKTVLELQVCSNTFTKCFHKTASLHNNHVQKYIPGFFVRYTYCLHSHIVYLSL